jgi:hypothetical protein
MGHSWIEDSYICNVCGTESLATDLHISTLFDAVTESPEILASRSVYQWKGQMWTSPFIKTLHNTKPEAVHATAMELKRTATTEDFSYNE